ncbi:hypothetical protein L2331_35925, partial [Mesorhizobium muleiense]|nr:hypothetical protein [Mesorhizobium muleiense]
MSATVDDCLMARGYILRRFAATVSQCAAGTEEANPGVVAALIEFMQRCSNVSKSHRLPLARCSCFIKHLESPIMRVF